MRLHELTLIAIALGLDAFGVALSLGINKGLKLKNKIVLVSSFSFFQFFFAFIGAYAGLLFNTYIVTVPKLIGGFIILIVGALMLKEGFEDKEESMLTNKGASLILGISVSIDAMVIGFTVLNSLKNNFIIFIDSVYIGIITMTMTVIAFLLSKGLKKIKIVSNYADYIGGVILIIFGLKMMFF